MSILTNYTTVKHVLQRYRLVLAATTGVATGFAVIYYVPTWEGRLVLWGLLGVAPVLNAIASPE